MKKLKRRNEDFIIGSWQIFLHPFPPIFFFFLWMVGFIKKRKGDGKAIPQDQQNTTDKN